MNAFFSVVSTHLADGGDSPSDIDSTTGHGPEWGEAAPIGLLVIVLLCIALYFLVKSMNRNLKKVPESFDTQVPVSVGGPAEEAGESTGQSAEPSTSAAPSGSARPDAPGSGEADPPGPPAPGSTSR